MRFSLLLLAAANTVLVLAEANPDAAPDAAPVALPEALPEAVPEAIPEALPEALPETEPEAELEAELEARTATKNSKAKCPTCPAILQKSLAPWANSAIAKEYCAAYANGTVSKNPACKNFGSLIVKDARLFCCCLWPNNNGTCPNYPPTPNPPTNPGNGTNGTNPTQPTNPGNGTNSTNPNQPTNPSNGTNSTNPGNGTNSTNSTIGPRNPRDLNGKPGLFRRMWYAWKGESPEPSMPINLVDGVPVETKELVQQPDAYKIRGGSQIRRRGLSLTLQTTEGVSLTLEVPDITIRD